MFVYKSFGHDMADSTGRRNTLFVDLREALVKRLGGCFSTQCLPGAGIESGRYGINSLGAMSTQVGAFGEVLA